MNRMQGSLMLGVVKRYSVESGYGFIKVADGGDDCFVHQSEIQTEGFRALLEGDKVQFIFSWRNGKSTATQVCPREGETLRIFKNKMEATQTCENSGGSALRCTGTCKWFNQEKGYGFLVRDGVIDGPDVFVHINKVKGEEFLSEGQRFQFDLNEEANGKLNAVNVVRMNEQGEGMSMPEYNPYPPYLPPGSSRHSPYQPQRPQHTPQAYRHSSPAPTQTYGAPYSSPYGGAPQPAGGGKTGKMKFFNVEKGFGFLFPDEGGKELYVGKSGLGADTAPEQLTEGTPVEYTVQTSDSKTWATGVRLVGGHQRQPRSGYGESYPSSPSKQNTYKSPSYSSGYSQPPAAPAPHAHSVYSQQPAAPHTHSGYGQQPAAPHTHAGYSQQPTAPHTHSVYTQDPGAPLAHSSSPSFSSGYGQQTANSHPGPPAHAGYSQGGQTANPSARPTIPSYESYY